MCGRGPGPRVGAESTQHGGISEYIAHEIFVYPPGPKSQPQPLDTIPGSPPRRIVHAGRASKPLARGATVAPGASGGLRGSSAWDQSGTGLGGMSLSGMGLSDMGL